MQPLTIFAPREQGHFAPAQTVIGKRDSARVPNTLDLKPDKPVSQFGWNIEPGERFGLAHAKLCRGSGQIAHDARRVRANAADDDRLCAGANAAQDWHRYLSIFECSRPNGQSLQVILQDRDPAPRLQSGQQTAPLPLQPVREPDGIKGSRQPIAPVACRNHIRLPCQRFQHRELILPLAGGTECQSLSRRCQIGQSHHRHRPPLPRRVRKFIGKPLLNLSPSRGRCPACIRDDQQRTVRLAGILRVQHRASKAQNKTSHSKCT